MPFVANLTVPHLQRAAIHVDALAAEPDWEAALRVEGFEVFSPVPGADPTGRTTVLVLSDDRALYLFFEAADPRPEAVRATVGRRDTRWQDDLVAFYLDPGATAQRAYLFAANAMGIQLDGTRIAGSNGDNLSWDGTWSSAGRRTASGYAVELAIPWRTVRHPSPCDRLGVFFLRSVARNGELSAWPRVDVGVQGMLVQEAVLDGPGDIPPSRGLDLLPELAFGRTQDGPAGGRPGWDGLFPGLTVRYAPVPSTSVLATLNPDFSEVESDSAQVDVNRRYALYYEEKRPFFLEGQEWFELPIYDNLGGKLVYTRSMVSPLYGARATVEGGGWTVAGLHVLDGSPGPSVSDGGGWTEEDLDGRVAFETVLRARRKLGEDGHLGAIVSDRTVAGTGLANRLWGVDGRTRVGDHLVLRGTALGSWTSFADGSSSLAPCAGGLVHYAAEHFYAGGRLGWLSSGFRAENGFVTQSDRAGGGTWGGITLRPGWKLLEDVDISPLSAWSQWTTAGELAEAGTSPTIRWSFENGSRLFLAYTAAGESYQGAWLHQRTGRARLSGSFARWLDLELGASGGLAPYYDPEDPRSASSESASCGMTLKPAPWAALGISVEQQGMSEEGAELYSGWVGRLRAEVYATGSLWARAILDRSTFDELRSGELLVAWEPAPGKGVYLGGSLALPPAEADPVEWQLTAKASWLLAL